MRGKIGVATSTFSTFPYGGFCSRVPFKEKMECATCKRKADPMVVDRKHKCSHGLICKNECSSCLAGKYNWPTCKICFKPMYLAKQKNYCNISCRLKDSSNWPKPSKYIKVSKTFKKFRCYQCKRNFTQYKDERYCSDKCRHKKSKINFKKYAYDISTVSEKSAVN